MANKLGMIRQINEILIRAGKFDTCMQKLNIIQVGAGKLEAELEVERSHTNVGNTLHGGMISSLVDYCSSLALVTDEFQQTGFSVDLSVTFVNPAKVGDLLLLQANTVKRGRSLAYLDVHIFNKLTNQVVAYGRQTKFTGHGLSPQ